MVEISTRARPPVSELMKASTARLKKKGDALAAEKRGAERRGDRTTVNRVNIALRALSLRAMTLGESIKVAGTRT